MINETSLIDDRTLLWSLRPLEKHSVEMKLIILATFVACAFGKMNFSDSASDDFDASYHTQNIFK
jgi:hypothetical protein